MQKATLALLGGAKRSRASSSSSSSSSSSGVTITAPGSGPRTHLPFLLTVVRKAQGIANTAGTSAPYRAYPQLPQGAPKQKMDGSTVLFKDDACIIVNDAFPKSRVHCLVMPLDLSLRSLNDLRYATPTAAVAGRKPTAASSSTATAATAVAGEAPLSNGLNHLELLRHMETTAQSYVAFLKKADPAAYGKRRFITGFHSLPSLPMLHMHLVSMDLDSPYLKTKKHYNSFATFFFLTADRVMADLERNGRVTINQSVEELNAMENQAMTCLWCGAPLSNIPSMKKHVPTCAKNKSMVNSLFRRRTDDPHAASKAGGGGYIDTYPPPQGYAVAGSSATAPTAAAASTAPPASLPTSLSAATAQEKENDAMVKALIADVRRAKQSFTKLGAEVQKQNAMLDALERAFDGAKGALSRVMTRMDRASGASSFAHMWALFLFVLLVFLFIYLFLTWRR